ncbi:MAG: hypothetical protein ACI3XG_09385 [Faecousia sp.]
MRFFSRYPSYVELERKELEIQKLQLDLEDANKKLQRISWMVPIVFFFLMWYTTRKCL